MGDEQGERYNTRPWFGRAVSRPGLHRPGEAASILGMGPPRVLLTGASRGIGRGIALELAASGMSVTIHYAHDELAARETAAACLALSTSGAQAFPLVAADLAQPGGREALVATTLREFGCIDALVNNAGIAPRERVDVTEATHRSFAEVVAVNLAAPHFLTQQIARHWLARPNESGLPTGYKLVFIGSISAEAGSLDRSEYCIAKAGLAMAHQVWAARLASEGIQSIEIRPGIMQTDMTAAAKEKYDAILANTDLVPQKRWGTPGDVAAAVRCFLVGDLPFSTGAVLHVDGGFHLKRL